VVALETTNQKLLAFKAEIKKYIAEHHFWEPEEQPNYACEIHRFYSKAPAASAPQPRQLEKEDLAVLDEEVIEPSLSLNIIHPKVTPFSEILFKLIDSRKLNDVAIYKKAQIDRRLFSKIRSDPEYNPSKETVYRLMLALELSIKDAKELLEAAGYSFGITSKVDFIVRHCVEHQIYDMTTVNEILFENAQKTI
jgi:hypothetical protein